MFRLCIFLQKLLTFNLLLSCSQDPLSNTKLEILEMREFILTELFACFHQIKVFLSQKQAMNLVQLIEQPILRIPNILLVNFLSISSR